MPVSRTYEIRRMTFDDIPQILSIATEGGLSAWSITDYVAEINRLDSVSLTANSSNAELIGFVTGRIVPGSDDADSLEAEIYNVGVRSERRRCGIGTALLERFLKVCSDQQVKRVWLEVRAKNEAAVIFYCRHGFEIEFVRKAYYRQPDDDANVMYTTL